MAAPFPMNAWYAAAWDVDIKHELFPRTICGKHVVMYRKADGAVAALEDACWHRLLPLSKGRLQGDTVVCGYHGLKYDAQGRCTFMPSQETINPSACVRAYPVVERHRYRLALDGRSGARRPGPRARPALERRSGLGRRRQDHPRQVRLPPRGRQSDGPHARDLRARLEHRQRCGRRGAVRRHPRRQDRDRDALDARASSRRRSGPRRLGKPGPVDRWQIIRFEAPCTIAIDVGVAPAGTGAPEGDRSQGVNGFVLNTITPETATTCHYFWAFARNYRITEQRLTTEMREGVVAHLPRGRDHPRGAAARDGRKPRPRLLQPQHRCRRDVGAPADRPAWCAS